MNSLIANPIFSLTGADSRALGMLAAVIHPVPEPGVYRGTIAGASGSERDFTLVVDATDVAHSASVDLAGATASAAAGCGCSPSAATTYRTGTGYVVFYVGSGVDRYYVRFGRAGAPERDAFDSRVLRDGDNFAVTLLRPGRYRVTEPEHRHKATIRVNPIGERDRASLREPVRVSVGAHGFSESRLEVVALQGLVFEVRANAAILIEPESFDDTR
jgi:hypothetical protein